MTATDRLKRVEVEIAEAERSARREAGSVTLVAVSKTFDATAIEPVIAAGQRVFGENRVQEAQGKWPELRSRYPDLELHLIGPLQTNKARQAMELFDAIETVDRPKLARTIAAMPSCHTRGIAGGHHELTSVRTWNTLLASQALYTQTWMVYVNRVGWEDGVFFSGESSVVDPFGRSHDHDNLWVVGTPTMVTSGCNNGTLTFSALALRSAAAVADELPGPVAN